MEEKVSINDIILIISSRIRAILIFPFSISIIGAFYIQYFVDPSYISISKVMSSYSSSGVSSQAMGLAAQFGIGLGSNQSEQNWFYPEVIKSRTLVKSLIKRKFNTIKYGNNKTLFDMLNENYDGNRNQREIEYKIVDAVIDMIKVSEDISTGIYTIQVEAFEPQFAADLNNMIIDELDKHQKAYNSSLKSEARIFIQERIFQVEKELSVIENKLKEFRDRNRRIENSPNLLLEEERLSREALVHTQLFSTLKQQLETTKIEELKDSRYVIVLDKAEAPIYRYKPKKRQFVISCWIFGLVLILLYVFIDNFFKNLPKKEKEKIRSIRVNLNNNIIKIFKF